MADLVLKNVDQVLIQRLEQRAKRLGITLEAAAVRALGVGYEHPDAELEPFLEGEDADINGPQSGTVAARDSFPQADRTGGVSASDAPTLEERQAALASAYPDEYVVLCGERVLVHTVNKDEAYAHYESAFDEAGSLEPIVIAPGALRRLGPPIIRGRALSGTNGTTR